MTSMKDLTTGTSSTPNGNDYRDISPLWQNEKNVGICGMEVYIPSMYISQDELEDYNHVSKGKYTKGLGQVSMGLVAGDVEDVNSIALTVVHMLLEKYSIRPHQVGRLEVGTETLVDKSKSTKTVLMDLFSNSSSSAASAGDMEGATIINACYGGTSALLNAMAWVESDMVWDGRYAIVVACDIATYARGPARPTCGIGAAAFLLNRDAPLVLDGPRATYAANTWDFYKPDPSVEYPVVDGALSQTCYYQALENCYEQYVSKFNKQKQHQHQNLNDDIANGQCCPTDVFTATTPDYFVFHAPYNKLVQKSYARLFLLDERRRYQEKLQLPNDNNAANKNNGFSTDDVMKSHTKLLTKWLQHLHDEGEWAKTYADRELDAMLQKMASVPYKEKLEHANYLSQQVGNTYTASVFVGLASLICFNNKSFSVGQTICVFSYGSGAIATMYGLRIRDVIRVRDISAKLNLVERLNRREFVHPSELDIAMEVRKQMHHRTTPKYQPMYSSVIDRLYPGTYYLVDIDSQWKRSYARLPLPSKVKCSPQDVTEMSTNEIAPTFHQNGDLKILHNSYKPLAPPQAVRLFQSVTKEVTVATTVKNCTMTNATQGMSIVITGVSAGLPGCNTSRQGCVFAKDNLERLVRGEQCIEPIPDDVKQAMVEKNVNRLIKLPDGTVKKELCTAEKVIQLAAQLQICTIDLSGRYGVPPGLAETMDVAAQVAVAAGMEALKSAGLVSGLSNHPSEWRLAEDLRDGTGVVYASSFPAMDAAVGEVMRFLNSRTVENATTSSLLRALRSRMITEGNLSADDEAAFQRLEALRCTHSAEDVRNNSSSTNIHSTYEFDRKFLFRVLVLGNAQLAQLAGCRGPNAQTNAACAGTTQAIAMAEDILVAGRADRVVVIAGDNGSGSTLLPWLGSGFCALGAATTAATVEDAALPFDKRRSGMVLGAGGIGMVLETEKSAKDRILAVASKSTASTTVEIKARLLATQYSNSAYHGAALDKKHISSELVRFLKAVEEKYGITKDDLATNGVYFSHETSTHASSATSCAGVEIGALREAFGDELLSKLLILNTKGFTGHPMVSPT